MMHNGLLQCKYTSSLFFNVPQKSKSVHMGLTNSIRIRCRRRIWRTIIIEEDLWERMKGRNRKRKGKLYWQGGTKSEKSPIPNNISGAMIIKQCVEMKRKEKLPWTYCPDRICEDTSTESLRDLSNEWTPLGFRCYQIAASQRPNISDTTQADGNQRRNREKDGEKKRKEKKNITFHGNQEIRSCPALLFLPTYTYLSIHLSVYYLSANLDFLFFFSLFFPSSLSLSLSLSFLFPFILE